MFEISGNLHPCRLHFLLFLSSCRVTCCLLNANIVSDIVFDSRRYVMDLPFRYIVNFVRVSPLMVATREASCTVLGFPALQLLDSILVMAETCLYKS